MAEEKRQEIYEMLEKYHNDDLFIPNEAPNGNTIYHLYSDGQITYQKGGFAYLQRSEFDLKDCIYKTLNLDVDKFKQKREVKYNSYGREITNTFGYVIVTPEHAFLIRSEMEKLAELL